MRFKKVAVDTPAAKDDDLFRSRLDGQIDLKHPLIKLGERMDWAALDDALAPTLPQAGGGRPALPVRLMAGLIYLKHANNLSDEDTCWRWLENPYWQYFTGEVYFQTRLPCDPCSLTRWRQRLGEAGMEELLAQTIATAPMIIDSTVHEKAITFPTNSRLMEVGRRKLVLLSQREGMSLRQTYEHEGASLSR